MPHNWRNRSELEYRAITATIIGAACAAPRHDRSSPPTTAVQRVANPADFKDHGA